MGKTPETQNPKQKPQTQNELNSRGTRRCEQTGGKGYKWPPEDGAHAKVFSVFSELKLGSQCACSQVLIANPRENLRQSRNGPS